MDPDRIEAACKRLLESAEASVDAEKKAEEAIAQMMLVQAQYNRSMGELADTIKRMARTAFLWGIGVGVFLSTAVVLVARAMS